MRAQAAHATPIGQQLGLFDAPPTPPARSTGLPPVKSSGPEVCYRNSSGQAWTGRGKPPRWIAEWVESGKSLEVLRVPGTKL